MSRSTRRSRPDGPQTPASDAHGRLASASGTRMIIEGDDALQRVASLLRSGGMVGQPGRLEALAEAIRASRPQLTRELLRKVERAADADPGEAVSRLLNRDGHDPDAFMAGAIVGFALGGAGRPDPGDERRSEGADPGVDPEERRETGVVESAQDVQTGSGGHGSLDSGHPSGDKE